MHLGSRDEAIKIIYRVGYTSLYPGIDLKVTLFISFAIFVR